MRRQALPLVPRLIMAGLLLVLPAAVLAAPLATLQAGGELGSTVVVGDVAYLAQGASISVWQLSSDGATAPVLVSTSAPLQGMVRGLAVDGDYLFASWADQQPYGGLVVMSLADPLHPVHALDFAYSTGSYLRPGGLLIVGSSLLLADPESGLYSIDISDPLAPTVDTMLYSFLDRLAVAGSHVVGWGAGFLGFSVEMFDVTDPSNPASVGYYGSFGVYDNAAVDGNLMVLTGDGFEVVSLADPAFPASLATVPSSGTYIHGGLVRGDFAYLGDENGVQVWDLTSPASPTAGALVDAPADRTQLAVTHAIGGGVEGLMFTESGRGLVLDLATPAVPTLEHTFDLPVGSDSTDAAVLGGGAVAISDFYSGLRVADDALASLGRVDPEIPQGGYEDLAVSGTTAYMTSWGSGLLTMDVTDPAAPSPLGSVAIPYPSAVDVAGSFAYVVTSTNGGVLQVVDVSNPASPMLRGMLPITHGWDVVSHDGLVLVADENGVDSGLRIIDASQPDAPIQVGHYAPCNSAGGVSARGELAFLACHDGSLHVVSLADPALPTQVGVYTDPAVYMSGNAVVVDDTVVWFGHTGGVDLVDVSDPAQPVRINRLELPAAVRGIGLDDSGNAWVAASLAGVYHIERVVLRDGFEGGDFGAWSAVAQ